MSKKAFHRDGVAVFLSGVATVTALVTVGFPFGAIGVSRLRKASGTLQAQGLTLGKPPLSQTSVTLAIAAMCRLKCEDYERQAAPAHYRGRRQVWGPPVHPRVSNPRFGYPGSSGCRRLV